MKIKKPILLDNYIVSQYICDFVTYFYNNNNSEDLYSFQELKNKLIIAKENFKLNSSQMLALCFQHLVVVPFDNKKNFQYNSKILTDFYKKVKKNEIEISTKNEPFIILPSRSFTIINIKKAIELIKVLHLENNIEDNVDALKLWDLNHYYYSLDYQQFLYYMQEEYDTVSNLLSEDEFFTIKANQFSDLLSKRHIYKSGVFKSKFDYLAKVNLKKFVANIKISQPIKYHS